MRRKGKDGGGPWETDGWEKMSLHLTKNKLPKSGGSKEERGEIGR